MQLKMRVLTVSALAHNKYIFKDDSRLCEKMDRYKQNIYNKINALDTFLHVSNFYQIQYVMFKLNSE